MTFVLPTRINLRRSLLFQLRVRNKAICTHVVHDVGPALHRDALEHCEHGEPEVVKVGDAVVWPVPVLVAQEAILTRVAFPARVRVVHHFI